MNIEHKFLVSRRYYPKKDHKTSPGPRFYLVGFEITASEPVQLTLSHAEAQLWEAFASMIQPFFP